MEKNYIKEEIIEKIKRDNIVKNYIEEKLHYIKDKLHREEII